MTFQWSKWQMVFSQTQNDWKTKQKATLTLTIQVPHIWGRLHTRRCVCRVQVTCKVAWILLKCSFWHTSDLLYMRTLTNWPHNIYSMFVWLRHVTNAADSQNCFVPSPYAVPSARQWMLQGGGATLQPHLMVLGDAINISGPCSTVSRR